MTSKFALVIANTEYQDASFAKFTAPGKDAEEFAQVLRDAELAAFDDVQVLINEGEGKTRRSIARFFVDRKPADLLLLYFSGHGVRNEQGQLFLAANDTEIAILEATGIPAEFITRAMNNSRSQRQLLILDCCNSGAFAHGSKSASGVGKSMGIATAFEGDGYGRVVLTATDATQFAWEGDKVIGNTQNSVFTHFLIDGLKGEADRDGDGRIKVDELYDYAYEQVVRRTPKQTPGKWSYKQQGDIILRENLKSRDVKPSPLPSDLLDLLSHPNSGVRKVGVQDLISLLEGKHLGLARAAEEKLREIAVNDDSFTLRKTASDTLIARAITLEKVIETPKETLSAVKPAPVEISKKEKRIEKPLAPPQKFSSQLGRRVQDFVQPRKLFERKLVIPQLDKHLLGKILGISLMIVFLGWAGNALINNWPSFNSPAMATSTSNPNPTTTLQATMTRTPLSTKTPIPPTPTLGIGSMITGKDGMTLIYVPAGEFTMGSDNGDSDEKPVHTVDLDAFWIDQTEVTNALFAKCVQDGDCTQPSDLIYYSDSNYANHPVVYVSWNDAYAYCSWADRRLPTEAEWEKAASWDDGTDEKYVYPWGNDFECTKGNFDDETQVDSYVVPGGENCDGFPRTSPVGSFSTGVSPYGVFDMAGNVWEWVADWYSETYYSGSPSFNPLGPDSGLYRVLRGGSWINFDSLVRSAFRYRYDPTNTYYDIGFRCSRSP